MLSDRQEKAVQAFHTAMHRFDTERRWAAGQPPTPETVWRALVHAMPQVIVALRNEPCPHSTLIRAVSATTAKCMDCGAEVACD